jgi:predicted RNA-binding protein Jag
MKLNFLAEVTKDASLSALIGKEIKDLEKLLEEFVEDSENDKVNTFLDVIEWCAKRATTPEELSVYLVICTRRVQDSITKSEMEKMMLMHSLGDLFSEDSDK